MKKLKKLIGRIKTENRGNVLMMTGFAIIPLVSATGIAVDYARAARVDTKLSAAADAAALAAISQPMMLKTSEEAKTYAIQIFNQQLAAIPGLSFNPSDLIVTVNDVVGVGEKREVSVKFATKSPNLFGSILGLNALEVGGEAGSSARRAPNFDFHLVLDTSPSMGLPTTSAGITQMSNMVGCQFACHTDGARGHGIKVFDDSTSSIVKTRNTPRPAGGTIIDAFGTYVIGTDVFNADGTYVDSYWLAKNKGINLRIDSEHKAAVDLMNYAKQVSIDTGAKYRAALHTFDYKENFKTLSSLTTNLTAVGASASVVEMLKVTGGGCAIPAPSPGFCSNFLTTSYTGALTGANSAITNPGNGTSATGDNPKKMLFIVTDGVSDEKVGTINRTRAEMQPEHIAQCNAIKARGITIAILYTEYLPSSIASNGTQGANVIKRLVGPTFYVENALRACASPDLMSKVTTDGDISLALKELFDKARNTAYLSK